MQFRLSEEQALIEASVRALLDGEYSFAQRQCSLDAPHGCRSDLWAKFATMGWLGLPLPQELGGLGGGALETGLLMRAFGRHLVVEPYLPCVLLAARLMARLARPEQSAARLAGVIEGRSRLALAHEESGRRDPWAAAGTSAVKRDGHWNLRGHKLLARGVAGADRLLVSATEPAGANGPARTCVFLLRPDAPGLTVHAARCADGMQAGDLTLDDVVLADADLLGGGEDAQCALHESMAWALVAMCWEAVGAMNAMHEATVAHVRQRVQFGRPLIQFQVVEHRVAEMAVCCEESLAVCELAALLLDRGDGKATALASMAKAKVGRAARFVAQQAVQLHGAMGVTEELPVASYFRRLTAFTQQQGSTDWHAQAYAQGQLGGGAWRNSRTLPAVGAR